MNKKILTLNRPVKKLYIAVAISTFSLAMFITEAAAVGCSGGC